MTSSLKPLIAVFILPEKMKVFQHGGDRERYRPQAPQNALNFLITVRKISPACDLVAKMLLNLKKHYIRPDYSRQNLRYDRLKKCPTILYGVNLWLKPSATLGLLSSAEYRNRLWLITKFQMRHRLISGLQRSWHNIIYDALPNSVYILRELFAPY